VWKSRAVVIVSVRVTPVVFQLSRQTLHSHNAVFDLRSLHQRDSQRRIRFAEKRWAERVNNAHFHSDTLLGIAPACEGRIGRSVCSVASVAEACSGRAQGKEASTEHTKGI
jgi:hypothetical protein